MKVTYSPRALAQIEDIHAYIAERYPRAAAAVVERIEKLCAMLGDYPGCGTPTDRKEVRVLPVVRYPYLIFYRILDEENEVRILRVRHGARLSGIKVGPSPETTGAALGCINIELNDFIFILGLYMK